MLVTETVAVRADEATKHFDIKAQPLAEALMSFGAQTGAIVSLGGVTAGTGTTALTVTRAQNGSAAISTISAGDVVTMGNPPGTSTANGSLFVHASFAGLPLSSGDSLSSTVKISFN